ncbi:MAG: hypothetical protein K0R64_2938 [Novosphingobium lindaniclasticum]|jgi:hypothetical protein|uniref:glycosyltransferase n=1 Tax=Novosphingobium lindaniclasticum TaxID=1329895 RepID=UPI00240972C5|nr:glycosyltransferase [Novosphingobium lindaniclasticum]MDF2639954.1 hypothetical protein [Novosphingobium lindaniclasticum]
MTTAREICFVFIGGTHQIYHLAPVAAEIARREGRFAVRCFCADEEAETALREIARRMQAETMEITRLPVPWLARLAVRVTGRPSAAKGPILASLRWRARRACAIVVPERTSAALRKMGWRRPLIHFRHGAGDRAPASEKRLRAFDLIVVPGEKDIKRAVDQGIDRARLRVGGYVKLDYLRIAPPAKEPLFDNGLPTVVYNPHFDPRISSLDIARDVIERFRHQDRYNLVFAPHIRCMEGMSQADRQRFLAQAVEGRIIVDLGSPSLFDMRYTQAADIYLGDVSSQLYEFLSRPRPAVFLNSHGADWKSDPRYAGWHLGEVADGPDTALAAIDRAVADHQSKIEAQADALKFAFGDFEGAIQRSTDILVEELTARQQA